jgi:hypothetical protein
MVLPQADRRSAVPAGERRDLLICTSAGHGQI